MIETKTNVQRYDAYKDSGVEWLGEIPGHWEVLPLFALTKLKSITNISGLELLSVYLDKGVIRFADVTAKRTNVTSLDLSKYQLVNLGDFVLNNQQAWRGSVGVSKYNGIVRPAYIVLSLSEKLNPFFANYLFRDGSMVSQYLINSKGVGTIQRNLYWPSIRRSSIGLPKFEEQTKIAQFLDDKTTKIEDAIAIKEQQINLLKERKQILIHKAVTQGLNPNVKLKNSGVEWIGEIPEHWNMIPVRRLIDVRDGTHDTPSYVDEEENTYPLVTSKDFVDGKINFNNIKRISEKDHLLISSRSGVKQNDVLMSMIGGNIGKSIIVEENDQFSIKNVALFRTRDNLILGKFLMHYFESGILDRQIELKSRGGAQGFLSLGDIRNLIFFKIPKAELIDIVGFTETSSQKIETAISLKQQEIEKLKEYKSSLINSVVTGKVKVC
jgi:type I restriction enzyme S subunit